MTKVKYQQFYKKYYRLKLPPSNLTKDELELYWISLDMYSLSTKNGWANTNEEVFYIMVVNNYITMKRDRIQKARKILQEKSLWKVKKFKRAYAIYPVPLEHLLKKYVLLESSSLLEKLAEEEIRQAQEDMRASKGIEEVIFKYDNGEYFRIQTFDTEQQLLEAFENMPFILGIPIF